MQNIRRQRLKWNDAVGYLVFRIAYCSYHVDINTRVSKASSELPGFEQFDGGPKGHSDAEHFAASECASAVEIVQSACVLS